ncbi:hypothetical protein KKF05_02670 [Patescibacteria group bacterium]|nr:hypothetical protein [Patescibacteria group bacterium]MBU1028658.1 hypothetical protein [Patescibacteria group bacterium]MBU1916363.1 hypothetical protein [Patescibacteria group bacterium]
MSFEETVITELKQISLHLGGVDQCLEGIDQHLDGVDQRLEGIDQHLDGVDQRLEGIDQHLDGLDEQEDLLFQQITEINEKISGLTTNERVDMLENKMMTYFDQQNLLLEKFNVERLSTVVRLDRVEGTIEFYHPDCKLH